MVRKITVGTLWRLPFHPFIKVVYGHFHAMWIYCPMLREKKVSPFKSGPFSKVYRLFLNWKLWLGKFIALLVGSYILTADKARARSQRWTQRAPGQAPCCSVLCSPCLSLLDTFCTETFLPTFHFAYLSIFVLCILILWLQILQSPVVI